MVYDRAPFAAHLDGLGKELKKQAFWKTALFGTVLLERQWPVYERLAVGREWGAAKEVRKVLDRLWKGIPTGVRIGDNFWMLLEDNPVEPVAEPWDPAAALMIDNTLRLMKLFREKDRQAAGELAERNLMFLAQALAACGEEGNFTHPLFQAELDFQSALCARLCQVPNSEKVEFVNACKGENFNSIMGELWFPDYPDYKPLKRRAKKKSEIRYSHIRYDEWFTKLREKDENGLDAWDRSLVGLREYDAWLSWPDQMPNDYPGQTRNGRYIPQRWRMPEAFAEVYDYLSLHIYLEARTCWACRGDVELVRGLFWLAARAQEASYALLDRGWPCSDYMDRSCWEAYLPNRAQHAICAGDWALAEKLLARYHKPVKLKTKPIKWNYPIVTRIWLEMVRGDDEEAMRLIQWAEEKATCWDDGGMDYHSFRCLINRDAKGLRKDILREIQSIRKSYENMCETMAPGAIALLKLARRRGMELDLPQVVEIPDGIWEDIPLDGERWKLPGQAVLDRALGPDGDKLLSEWKKLAKEKTK